MSHLPLDARAILQHLNELGYRNISAEQLREFLKDLRKLIKYEERLADNGKGDDFSSLHKRGTVSSRAKLTGERNNDKDKENACPCLSSAAQGKVKGTESKTDRDDQQQRPNAGVSEAAFSDLARLFREKLLMEASIPPDMSKISARYSETNKRRSRSLTRQESGKQLPSSGESESDRPRVQSRRRSRSRPRSASRGSLLVRRQGKSRHDPVALYQYYQKEWAHFRGQIPGETSHLSARFGVRN
ncbi:hypothetical protein KR009_002618, partial [Drosophila setifemur]